MTCSPNLDPMTSDQLRAFATQLVSQVDTMGKKIHRIETVNEHLSHEIALLKRHKFAKRSEQLSPAQGSLLEDLIDSDIAAVEAELKAVNPPMSPAEPRQQPKRACRCIAKKKSLATPAWQSHARHWRNGSAKPACNSNPWSTRYARSCLLKA